jgi:serine/threonine protein phosphatase PrpC
MKVSYVYDQGSSKYREDGIVVGTTLFGVLDGVSEPYGPKYPLQLVNGYSPGEVIVREAEKSMMLGEGDINLKQNLGNTNRRIAKLGMSIMSGATFAFANIVDGKLEITQGGDCFVVVLKKDGTVFVTKYQVRAHDIKMNGEIERLMAEVAKERGFDSLESVLDESVTNEIRGEMWNRFCITLRKERVKDMNRPDMSDAAYGLLNGDNNLLRTAIFRNFELSEISVVLLFSDGMIPWNLMKSSNDQKVGEDALKIFQQSGLAGLLSSARGEEEKNLKSSYTNFAEATAIVIEF